jgi:hypothetical protein
VDRPPSSQSSYRPNSGGGGRGVFTPIRGTQADAPMESPTLAREKTLIARGGSSGADPLSLARGSVQSAQSSRSTTPNSLRTQRPPQGKDGLNTSKDASRQKGVSPSGGPPQPHQNSSASSSAPSMNNVRSASAGRRQSAQGLNGGHLSLDQGGIGIAEAARRLANFTPSKSSSSSAVSINSGFFSESDRPPPPPTDEGPVTYRARSRPRGGGGGRGASEDRAPPPPSLRYSEPSFSTFVDGNMRVGAPSMSNQTRSSLEFSPQLSRGGEAGKWQAVKSLRSTSPTKRS